MQAAFTDTSGRVNPKFVNLASGELVCFYGYCVVSYILTCDHILYYQGNIGGQILLPGLYQWSSSVNAATGFTIFGGSTDSMCFCSSCIDPQNSTLIATHDSLDIPNFRHVRPRDRGRYDPSRRRAGIEHRLGSIPSCNTPHELASRRRGSRTDIDHGPDWDVS